MARDIATSMTPSRRLGPCGGDRVRSTAHGLSKVDAALLGAALVILGERVNSASGDGSLRFLPADLKSVSADQNFELSPSSSGTLTLKLRCYRLCVERPEGRL